MKFRIFEIFDKRLVSKFTETSKLSRIISHLQPNLIKSQTDQPRGLQKSFCQFLVFFRFRQVSLQTFFLKRTLKTTINEMSVDCQQKH